MLLKIWDGENIKIQGFTLQPGFVALVEDDDILAVTSGWEHQDSCGPMLFVYRPQSDGTWVGRWEDETTFPVEDVLDAMEAWRDNQDLQKALAYAKGKKLYLSNEDIVFTDVVPGDRCNDGGEYGFYTRYRPIPGYPGIYRVSTETSCEFDACGTGYQGIRALTTREYRRLKKASDKVEAAGSLY
jgi:hypothetical protein